MFSSIVMDHFFNPRNVGTLESPDAIGKSGSPGEGEFVILHLKLEGDTISEASFQTFGCGPAIASCSFLTEWVKGKTVKEAGELTPEKLSELLGGLPPDKMFCAGLAVSGLKNALDKCS
jgi:nitrogen fixation NifU-like protein